MPELQFDKISEFTTTVKYDLRSHRISESLLIIIWEFKKALHKLIQSGGERWFLGTGTVYKSRVFGE